MNELSQEEMREREDEQHVVMLRRANIEVEASRLKLVDAHSMYEVVDRVLREHLYTGASQRDLIRREPIYQGDRVVGERLMHELRLRKLPFSESGTIGKTTDLRFELKVHMAVEDALEQLKHEQPGCDWRLIAADVQRVNLRRTEPRTFRGKVVSEINVHKEFGDPDLDVQDPIALKQKVELHEVPDYRLYAVLVFADLGEGDLMDPHALHADNPAGATGPMTRYAQTRDFSHLSASQKRMRVACEELIKSFLAPAPLPGAPAPLPGPGGSRSSGFVPEGSRADPEAELREKARQSRKNGVAPAHIARSLGVSNNKVREWVGMDPLPEKPGENKSLPEEQE